MLHSINHEQKLYVLKSGNGYSCLGFEVAEKRRMAALAFIGSPDQSLPPLGTAEHYAAYVEAMKLGQEHSLKTGKRCLAELEPKLAGLERKRVEVVTPWGEKSRFWVGRSTGWMPCHLEIKTRRSCGGCAAYVPEGATVRVIR